MLRMCECKGCVLGNLLEIVIYILNYIVDYFSFYMLMYLIIKNFYEEDSVLFCCLVYRICGRGLEMEVI